MAKQKELDVNELINMNYRILTLLGIATSLIMERKPYTPKDYHYKYDWFSKAVNEVVYLNKPLPEFPENFHGK